MSDENQRSYFRVNDHALLKIRVIDAAEYDTLNEDFDGTRLRYSLSTHFDHLRALREPTLRLVRQRDPDVARYLEHLETQLETLAVHVTKDADFEPDAQPQPINLSATGVRFLHPTELVVGQAVEIGMMLYPNERVVMALGSVVRSDRDESNEGADWLISLNFDKLDDEDQELLIKHVHRVQRNRIQARRDNQDAA